jgi:hypothetical protein
MNELPSCYSHFNPRRSECLCCRWSGHCRDAGDPRPLRSSGRPVDSVGITDAVPDVVHHADDEMIPRSVFGAFARDLFRLHVRCPASARVLAQHVSDPHAPVSWTLLERAVRRCPSVRPLLHSRFRSLRSS